MTQALSQQRHLEMLHTALGEALMSFLSNDDVIEIMANPDGKVFVDTLSRGKYLTDIHLSNAQSLSIIKLIASLNGLLVNDMRPELSCELHFASSRFQAWLPPVSEHPTFCIRKKAKRIFTLDNYVEHDWLTPAYRDFLKEAIKNRRNILIAGGTGSGKTTFANALLHELTHANERILVLEDLPELQLNAADVVHLQTTETINMRDLVKSCLRMRPDRIVIGEVRDAAALDLLKAWNTGHPGGICTIHANRADSVGHRLADLMMEAVPQVPHRLIEEAVDIVIFMQKVGHHNYTITQVSERAK